MSIDDTTVAEPFDDRSDELDSWIPGRILLDEYVIKRVLGRGGMGEVFLVKSNDHLFAVKTLLTHHLGSIETRRMFARELRTWIDLPEFTYLNSCRFFKTIQKRLAIFAEYIEGGSLKDWIRGGKLTTIEAVLDIAIQFAWGIHMAHESGVIHQDIKPGNVLMTPDGIVKVTDFGLASMKKRISTDLRRTTTGSSELVTSSGLTIAYCSPEQLEGKKLGRQSDLWSYGLSILEILNGEMTWRIGATAEELLKRIKENGPGRGNLKINDSLFFGLDKCFKYNVSDRWVSMEAIADYWVDLFERMTGKTYPRPKPNFSLIPRKKIITKRKLFDGIKVDDPKVWLGKIVEITGKGKKILNEYQNQRGRTQKAQRILDIEIFEESANLLMEYIDNGHPDAILDLALLLRKAALLQEELGDFNGAVEKYNMAFKYLDCLEPMHSIAAVTSYVSTGVNQSYTWMSLRKYHDAFEVLNTVITKAEMISLENPDPILSFELIYAYSNQTCSAMAQKKFQTAVNYANKAIDIINQLRTESPEPELLNQLAVVTKNKAAALHRMGKIKKAISLFKKVIEIREKLSKNENWKYLKAYLASDYINLGQVCVNTKYQNESQSYFLKALKLLEKDMLENPSDATRKIKYVRQIVRYIENQTFQFLKLNLQSYIEKAESLLDQLISREGRSEAEIINTRLMISKAIIAFDVKDFETAIGLLHHAESRLSSDRSFDESFERDQLNVMLYFVWLLIDESQMNLENLGIHLELINKILSKISASSIGLVSGWEDFALPRFTIENIWFEKGFHDAMDYLKDISVQIKSIMDSYINIGGERDICEFLKLITVIKLYFPKQKTSLLFFENPDHEKTIQNKFPNLNPVIMEFEGLQRKIMGMNQNL